MSMINQIQTALKKRAAYTKTKHEIRNLPLDVALDLGIFREDADRIAYNAVYGATK